MYQYLKGRIKYFYFIQKKNKKSFLKSGNYYTNFLTIINKYLNERFEGWQNPTYLILKKQK